MIIIAGLRNPGKEYENTRHNVGFMVVDRLAKEYGIDMTTYRHKALVGKGTIEGKKVILAKPQTFMNLSGESIRALVDYYKPDETSDVLVCYDDISLDIGGIRVRKNGSAGGHNGMKNIILHLSSEEFPRVRVGIGEKPPKMDLADWVLSHFSKEDKEILDGAIDKAVDAVKKILSGNIDEAMNQYNRKVNREE